MKYKFLLIAVVALVASACGKSPGGSLASIDRSPLKIGSQTLSLPTGKDGYVLKAGSGANWGYDPIFWKATIGQVGSVAPIDQPIWAVVGRSDPLTANQEANWPLDLAGRPLKKEKMKLASIAGRDFYQSKQVTSPKEPFYLFSDGLDGFVYCPSNDAVDSSVDSSRCWIHIRKNGIHHSFHISEGQLELASEVAKVFVATLTPP